MSNDNDIDIVNAIQLINGAVTGVLWAPPLANYPASLKTAQLPMTLTWPWDGEATWAAINGLRWDNGNFLISVFVEPVGQDMLGPSAVSALILRQAFKNAYGVAAVQDLSDTVEQIGAIRYTGLIELTYGKQTYRGFQITIPTIRKRDV